MKKIFLSLLLAFPLNALSIQLKVGDILLQPLRCWSCTLIEEQEESIYSHMGIVIETSPEVLVAEALTTVRVLTLKEFNSRTEKGQKLSVRRFRNSRARDFIRRNERRFQDMYYKDFDGLHYDHAFLWNNFDDQGNEKLYCSEMVTKLLSGFLRIEIPMKRMKFDKNRAQWIKYFRGNPPDGKWGNSPAVFEQSDLFFEAGEL